jgi:hypothetical protein
MISRYLPLAGVGLIVLITLGVRPWLQTRRYGTSGVLLFALMPVASAASCPV